jgi:hypothetical protein
MAWPGSAYYYLGTLSQALNASIAHLTSIPGGLALAGAAAAAAAWPGGSSPYRGRAGPAWFPDAAADGSRHQHRGRTGSRQQQQQEAQGSQKYWQVGCCCTVAKLAYAANKQYSWHVACNMFYIRLVLRNPAHVLSGGNIVLTG